MKIVIDVPKAYYDSIKETPVEQSTADMLVIRCGKPLSNVLETIRGDIWLDGVNMTGEYQGVWTRFRDVEKAFDKQMEETE